MILCIEDDRSRRLRHTVEAKLNLWVKISLDETGRNQNHALVHWESKAIFVEPWFYLNW